MDRRQLLCLHMLVALALGTVLCYVQRSQHDFSQRPRPPVQPHSQHMVELTVESNPYREHVCNCSGTTANCSHRMLTYIPKLPNTTLTLIFSFNNLTRLHGNVFENVTEIVSLDLASNGINYISPEAFTVLQKLQNLTLDYNPVTYQKLLHVLTTPNLQVLSVRFMKLRRFPDDYFSNHTQSKLTQIDVSGNQVKHLNMTVLMPLSNLTHLTAAGCRITKVTTDHLPQLTHLDLQANALFDLPDTCRHNSSLLPQLNELNFAQNTLSGFSNIICLPQLHHLTVSKNPISTLHTDMFNQSRFPNLYELSLESVTTITKIESYAFRNPTLKRLSLMYCDIPLSDDYVDPDTFLGTPSLEFLQVSHNLGSYIPDEKFIRLFGSLTSLRFFYIGYSGVQVISKKAFSKLTKLEILFMYRNIIPEIPDGAFDGMTNLTQLGLNDNQLRGIRETTFSAAVRNNLLHFDISGNPLQCDCHLLWFKQWFDSTPSLFKKSYKSYTCNNLDHAPLDSFYLNEQACVFSRETYKALIACMALFISLLLLASAMYQHRWYIRLMLAFRGHGDIMRRRLQAENFKYDIFVSCADEDEAWVLDHLIPQLEGKTGLRLCFHQRDFTPGKNILNNIVDSVKNSKKFLMVFSKSFSLSRWCQFELDLCLSHVFDNDDDLLVTYLGEIEERDLTSTMKAVLKTTTYIRWEKNPNARPTFWERLNLVLREIIPRND